MFAQMKPVSVACLGWDGTTRLDILSVDGDLRSRLKCETVGFRLFVSHRASPYLPRGLARLSRFSSFLPLICVQDSPRAKTNPRMTPNSILLGEYKPVIDAPSMAYIITASTSRCDCARHGNCLRIGSNDELVYLDYTSF